jgi:hypothetical protein
MAGRKSRVSGVESHLKFTVSLLCPVFHGGSLIPRRSIGVNWRIPVFELIDLQSAQKMLLSIAVPDETDPHITKVKR